MKKERTTLLAGIAALALIAGIGAASAQQTGNEQGAKQPNAASHEMNKGAGTMGENGGAQSGTAGKMDQNAAEENKPGSSKMGQNADQQNGGKMDRGQMRGNMDHGTTAQDRDRFNHQNAAQRNERNGPNTAEQERNGLKGLQGNARVNVQINDEQRTRIRETVINARGAPRVDRVDFNIAVGTVVPRTGVRIVPVPATLVSIEPAWRGLNYFVYEEELVLIDPATMTIVAVITV